MPAADPEAVVHSAAGSVLHRPLCRCRSGCWLLLSARV